MLIVKALEKVPKALKGAMPQHFIGSAQQLVCSEALSQTIEAVDKTECQRADGRSETERSK